MQQIEMRAPHSLKPRKGNPRRHSKKQIQQIAASIAEFGFTNPILVDNDDTVIAGHGRLAAAVHLDLPEVPTLRLALMTEAAIRAYVMADNRIAELSDWAPDLLKIEFEYLSDLEIGLDLTVMGWEMPEIDGFIEGEPAKADIDSGDDDIPDLPAIAVTRPGDVWRIGPHRLICGDATDAATYAALMGEERAQMAFDDPPYNVRIEGHVSSAKTLERREFLQASGEMSPAAFTSFLSRAFTNAAAYSVDGAFHFHCMDWRHMAEMLEAGKQAYHELKMVCVWNKTGAGMGSFYRSQHELVFVFKLGAGPHINNIKLGRYGRNRSNVWTYAGANGRGARRKDLELHPTIKPVALVADAIRDCSNRKDLILDPFGGSGTTLVACERTGRYGRAIELDPAYCDVIVARMQKRFGLAAILERTGQTFDEIRHARLAAAASAEARHV